jgi:thiol-disulfide isomerase/thioredoxin
MAILDYLPYFVLAAIAALMLAVWVPRWRMLRTVGRPAPDLQGVSCACADEAGRDALYFFFSPHCGRCRAVGEALDRLAARGTTVVRVDVTAQECDVPRRFGVREVPAVVAIEQGRVARVLVGPQVARALEAGPPIRPARA